MKKQTLCQAILLIALALVAGSAPAAGARDSTVEDKLRALIIPEVKFQQAGMQDVISFLVETTREIDPKHRGVNIILDAGPGPANTADKSPAAEATQITFSARYVSAQEVLKIVTQLAGFKYRIEGNIVRVLPVNAPDGELVSRSYVVLPTFPDKMNALRDSTVSGKQP